MVLYIGTQTMILFLLLTPSAFGACLATAPTVTEHRTTTAAGGGEVCPCKSYPPVTPQAYAEERLPPLFPKVILPDHVENSILENCSFNIDCSFLTTDGQVIAERYPYAVVKTADGTNTTVNSLLTAQLGCDADKWYDNGLEIVSASCYGILE